MSEKVKQQLKRDSKEYIEKKDVKENQGLDRVCREKYPAGFYKRQRYSGFYMHPTLKEQIDFYINNATDDWDFVVIVAGEGEVRVGKSVLAMQIAAYWTEQMKKKHGIEVPFNLKQNFVFDGKKLIEKGNKLGKKHKHSALIFDEAGADLEGTKAMLNTTRAVKDFLRECGQYNFLTILVLPEFFDLPKGIAINRSRCLINVYWLPDEERGKFRRGFFKFYSIPNKRKLYLKGKRYLNYNAAPYDFFGDFRKFYPIQEDEYRELKIKALKGRESTTYDKKLHQRNIAWYLLTEEFGMTQQDLAKKNRDMGAYTIQQTISEALKGVRLSQKGKSEDK